MKTSCGKMAVREGETTQAEGGQAYATTLTLLLVAQWRRRLDSKAESDEQLDAISTHYRSSGVYGSV